MDKSPMLSTFRTSPLGVIGGLACAFLTAGCMGTVRAGPPVVYAEAQTTTYSAPPPVAYTAPAPVVYTEPQPEVVDVQVVPPAIETYPVEVYGGVSVYLVDGRWYRRSGNRWQTYRTEPVELGRRRAILERRAPRRAQPAPRHYDNRGHHDNHRDDHGYHR